MSPQTSLSDLNTRFEILSSQLASLKVSVDKVIDDHEVRVRNLEASISNMREEIRANREKLTVLNLVQATFSTFVGALAYWMGTR